MTTTDPTKAALDALDRIFEYAFGCEEDRKDYDTVKAALQRQATPTAGEWQPISTAPRDGTHILLMATMKSIGHPDKICVVANAVWNDEHEMWCDIENIMGQNEPEYWQPLPAPPHGIKVEGG